jgi:ligand-binding sensor domain-containing protein/nitrogen-specific signal transduction histidine kinase
MKALLTVLAALLLLQICLAQNDASTLHFNLLSIKDGMPEGQVNDLLQDKEGYIWIGTQKGLVRYDGYNPKVYDFGITDPYAIFVYRIFEDSKGELWVGVINTLYKYDRAGDRFITYPIIEKGNILFISEDETGDLWIHTGDRSGKNQKLILFNPTNKKEVLFGMGEKGKHHINATIFREVFKDKKQQFWVGSSNGLYQYNVKDSTFIPHFASADSSKQIAVSLIQEDAIQPGIYYFSTYNPYSYKAGGFSSYNSHTDSFKVLHHDAKNGNSIGSDTIWQVQNDSKGSLWVLTAAGLSLFNPANGTFTNYPDKSFKSYNGTNYTIKEDHQGNLWCNSNMGLLYFNVRTRQFTRYTADRKLKDDLVNNNVYNLMIDHSGILWLGVAQECLQWVDTKHHRFIKYADDNTAEHLFRGGQTNSFAKAADGTIWLGTEHGLYHWLLQRDSFQFIKFAPDENGNTFIRQVVYDSKGLIWFSAYNDATGKNGLYCYSSSSGKTINYRNRKNDTTSLSNDAVSFICEDHLGEIWIGTWGSGICRFNRHSQTFTRFPFILNDLTISNTHGALDDDQIQWIYEDKAGTLWVGTNNGGLNRFNRQQGTFTSYVGKLPGFACVISIIEDSKGRLWAGTFLGGLFELTKNRDSIKRFTEKDGLLYDGVIATAEDNTGNIWVTSRRGISILNPTTRQVRTIPDGNNFYRYNSNVFKASTGDFLIGFNNGFISLNPDDYAPDTHAPGVHIEALHLSELVNNKPKDSVVVAITGKSYQFTYYENRISFHYVGLYYQDAANTQYAYKLDGYDKDWIPAGTQRTVTYTNLAPRTYTFYVKAANSDGVWSKEESLTFTITPPWWETWWFRIFSVIAMFVVVYFIVQKQSRHLKKQNIVLEEKVQDRTKELKHSLEELRSTQAQLIQSEKMASLGELTAGIAHEIQNPLNFVNNFSEVNKELLIEMKEEIDKGDLEEVKLIVDDVISNEEKISHHGKRADSIVKGMLQHSKASTGKKDLTDINALVDESLRLSYHGLRAKDKGFNATINTDFDEGIGKINIISQDISRVLLNLFNNAFYAVNEKKSRLNGTFEPALSVCTKRENGKVEILVKDNGNGIPQSIIDKIFQPFFTTKPTGQGTGLGLSLSYDIIKAHGGEIKVESEEGAGTEFSIKLPI